MVGVGGEVINCIRTRFVMCSLIKDDNLMDSDMRIKMESPAVSQRTLDSSGLFGSDASQKFAVCSPLGS